MTSGRDKERSRRNRTYVRKLFMEEWDPIGARDIPEAQDEYDGYAAKAYLMLIDENVGIDEIAHYLSWVEHEHMGLESTADSHKRIRRVAAALVAMRPKFEAQFGKSAPPV